MDVAAHSAADFKKDDGWLALQAPEESNDTASFDIYIHAEAPSTPNGTRNVPRQSGHLGKELGRNLHS